MAPRAGIVEAVRLLLNEMWSPGITADLRVRGHDVASVAEAQRGRPHAGLIFTTDRQFPRSDKRSAGRVATSLAELPAGIADAVNVERWL